MPRAAAFARSASFFKPSPTTAKTISRSSARSAAASRVRSRALWLLMLIVPEYITTNFPSRPSRRDTGLSLGPGLRKSVSTQFGRTASFVSGTPFARRLRAKPSLMTAIRSASP